VYNGSEHPSHLYDDLCFVPRTYVAGNAVFSMDSQQTLTLLSKPEFDAQNTAIIAAPNQSAADVSGTGPAGTVEVVSREPNSVTLDAHLTRPGYVMLLDRYDPDWEATIDGNPAPIFRANQIFRAVYSREGSHSIRFFYRQRGLKGGMLVSLLTILGLIALYLLNPFASWEKQ
jgi:uncharacterized membrane protein YfhO